MPTSNLADTDKTLINLNSLFIRLIVTSLEEIGIDVILNQDNAGLIEPLVDWLITQYFYSCEQGDKKTILRIFRYLFMGLSAIGPKAKEPKTQALADVFLNKRSKETWSLIALIPPEE